MSQIKLLVLAPQECPQLRHLGALSSIADIFVGNSWEAVAPELATVEVVLYWDAAPALLEQVCLRGESLRWVHSKSAGVEPILSDALINSSAVLTNAAGVYARSLSEFALAGMLYFAKDFPRMLANQRLERWEQYQVTELAGRTLSIFGYGGIGQSTAERAKAFDMRVIANRRNARKSEHDPYVDEISLFDEPRSLSGDRRRFFAEADYLLVSAPLTDETRGVIGVAELEMMKPEAVIINVGRGPIIDEAALVSALSEQRIRGAVLDVFEREPLPEGHPFWQLPNVLLSPHTADQTDTWLDDSMSFFIENFRRWVSDQPLENIANKRLGY